MQVVSLSGGKDSTAMLLMMLERGEPVDEVVWCDTGMEFPEMYEHVDRLEEHTGLRFTRLRSEETFEHLMFERRRMRGDHADVAGYGWPRPHARWCTSQLKTYVIRRWERTLGEGTTQCVGIAADEAWRCKDKRYPLVEWGVTEAEALAYCRARGFSWGGLYDTFRRVSCWCCPFQRIGELRKLREHRPELWRRLMDMDERAWNTFRIGTSVAQLEDRFAREDAQMRLF